MALKFNGKVLVTMGALVLLSGCFAGPEVPTEHYYPATRQLPPDKVYSRLGWSHTAHPAPQKSGDEAPMISPAISFEMRNSNLGEAIGALARNLDYRADVPAELSSRPVSLTMTGSAEQVLAAVGREAGVKLQLDTDAKVIRVQGGDISPQLPEAAKEGSSLNDSRRY